MSETKAVVERLREKLRERAGFMREAGHADDAELDDEAADLIERLAARAERAEAERDKADNALVDRYRNPKTGVFSFPGDVAAIVRHLDAAEAEHDALAKALEWYEEQARLCRKLTDDGHVARIALDADGGKRAREALSTLTKEPADEQT